MFVFSKLLSFNLFKWIVVGTTSTLIDFFSFGIVFRMENSVVKANLVAAFLSTTFNYLMNFFFTFNPMNRHRATLSRYLIVQLITFLISTLILKIFIENSISASFSKSIIIAMFLPINYLVQKYYIYRHLKSKSIQN